MVHGTNGLHVVRIV